MDHENWKGKEHQCIFPQIKAFEKMDHLARAQRMLELQEAENARVSPSINSTIPLSIHPFSAAYLGSGRGSSSLSREVHTSLSPAILSSSSELLPPACPGSSCGVCSEHLTRKASSRHPN